MDIKDYSQMMSYLTRPRDVVPESRNMYNQGQLVQPSGDGSRPGYSGEKKLNKTMEKRIVIYDEWAKKNNKPLYKSGKLPGWKKYDIREGNWTGEGKGARFKDPAFMKEIKSEGSAIQQVRDYLNNSLKQNKGKPIFFKTIPEIKKLAGVTSTGKGIDGDISRALTGMFKDKVLLRNFDKLPNEVIDGIKTDFSDIISKDQWNFDKYKFGVNKEQFTEKVYDRIRAYVQDPKPTRYGFGFSKPEGWMLVQMDRAWRSGNKNYKPIYRQTDGKVIGYVDNTASGQGKKWFVSKDYIKGKNSDGLLLGGGENYDAHLDFNENKKYHDIVQKAGKQPNRAITQILKDGGIDQKVQLRHIINYLLDNSDLSTTKNSIVRHHRGSLQNATQDLQILNRVQNAKVIGIEKRIRDGIIKPDDIAKLNRFGVSVRDPNTRILYGKGPTTAEGGLKKINELILKGSTNKELYGRNIKGLQDFTKIDFNKFKTYLEDLCPKKASGGRIGFKFAGGVSSRANCGRNHMSNLLKNGTGSTEERNIIRQVMKVGFDFAKGTGKAAVSLLNPKEFLKLKNWVGKPAIAFMAGVEALDVADRYVRQGIPINEALGEKWTKFLQPKSLQEYQVEGMREKNALSSPASKRYAKGIELSNDLVRAYDQLEMLEKGEKAKFKKTGDAERIADLKKLIRTKEKKYYDYLYQTDEKGNVLGDGELDFKKDYNEYRALTKRARDFTDLNIPFTDIGGMNDMGTDEMSGLKIKKDYFPMYEIGTSKIPSEQELAFDATLAKEPFVRERLVPFPQLKDFEYQNKELPTQNRINVENVLTDEGVLPPRTSLSEIPLSGKEYTYDLLKDLTDDYNRIQKSKEARMYPAFQGSQFSEGGITELRSKYEYKK